LILKIIPKGSLCDSTIILGDFSATRVDQTRDLLSTKPPVITLVSTFARCSVVRRVWGGFENPENFTCSTINYVREKWKVLMWHALCQPNLLSNRRSSSQQTRKSSIARLRFIGWHFLRWQQRMKTMKISTTKKNSTKSG
jgi:hypothetical protein